MMYALMGVLIVESVLLSLLTLLVIAAGVLIAITAHAQWTNATGGTSSGMDSLMGFFRRVKQKDGSFSLVPFDEVEEDAADQRRADDDEAASWEDDYVDGVIPGFFSRSRDR